MTARRNIVALAGGVGGAKLAHGLTMTLAADELAIVVNTADDFSHLGLHVSPDLDTVMYTLAGIDNAETGWGIAGESWAFMAALKRLGGETWFRLGDRDLATHVERTRRLAAGETLSDITTRLCAALGIDHPIIPMSDQPVRTIVHSGDERIAFQDYFVRRRCEPPVSGFTFDGADAALPAPALDALIAGREIDAVILCPSNPYVSIDPILAVPGIAAFLRDRRVPAVAVSPIVGGRALKGPAAKMMVELGAEATAVGVARHYGSLIDGFIIDVADRALAGAIEALGLQARVTETVMKTDQDKASLARTAIDFAGSLAAAR